MNQTADLGLRTSTVAQEELHRSFGPQKARASGWQRGGGAGWQRGGGMASDVHGPRS